MGFAQTLARDAHTAIMDVILAMFVSENLMRIKQLLLNISQINFLMVKVVIGRSWKNVVSTLEPATWITEEWYS